MKRKDYVIPIVIPTYEPSEGFVDLVKELASSASAIIVVDDGSGEDYDSIFKAADDLPEVTVLKHAINLGKGRSLKTAFNYILDQYPDSVGVVTADSDGQHLLTDINSVMEKLIENPNHLIMGCRDFKSNDVPWKSRFGNAITRWVFAYLCGISVSDTQTGLRGIPLSFLKIIMHTPGERFEYETNMLLECNDCIPIIEVPIETIYDSKENHRTHFDTLRDSINIYKVILSYSLSSMAATLIDFLIFSLVTWIGYSVYIATASARFIAMIVSFVINRHVVFKSKGNARQQVLKFAVLVFTSGLISAFLISKISSVVHLNIVLIKAIVELVLFFFNYYIQRTYIFVKRRGDEIEKSVFCDDITESTDWTKYYQGKKSWVSTFTQKFTLERIISAIDKYTDKSVKLKICELGGGNSCFCEKLCEYTSVETYNIIDSNPLSVKLFAKLEMNADNHNGICRNLLENEVIDTPCYDFVYSIGLVEHFRGEDIRTMIKRHFDYCKDGGIVFVTFPTPTKKYLFIRKGMELFRMWQFHDERPIRYEEVAEWFGKNGVVLEHYINKKLPLTQEVVIVRKCTNF